MADATRDDSEGLDPFHFDRTWVFPVTPAALWSVISRTGDFRRWWPWLRRLDGGGLFPGGRAHCVVRAPIPYTLRFTVAVDEVVPERSVGASVAGDLAGDARLDVAPHPDGSRVRLTWDIDVRKPMLRRAAGVARPVMKWGHDWVVDRGVEQFCDRALGVGTGHDDRT